MTAEENLIEDVRAEYTKNRSYFRTATKLGLEIAKVRSIIQNNPVELTSSRVREAKYGGQGRPELRPYIVASRAAMSDWDLDSPEIVKARQDYMRGTHEMVQGRDGDTIIQYSIPRAVSQPRPGYFSYEI